MHPSLSSLQLPGESETYFVHKISDLFTTSECEAIIKKHESDLASISGTYSTRLRDIFDDEELSSLLWERLKTFYQDTRVTDDEGQTWRASELNNRFRFCKYKSGDDFKPHIDGCRLASVQSQSFMTVNVYLNAVPEGHGGATRVLKAGSRGPGDGAHEVLGKIQPEVGTASVFRSDTLFHDGEELKEGVKYLLRTDIMFEREAPYEFDKIHGELTSTEKAGKALDLAQRLEDGGNSAEAVTWYKKAFRLDPALEAGG